MDLRFKPEVGDLIRLKDGSCAYYHENTPNSEIQAVIRRRGIEVGDNVVIESTIFVIDGDLSTFPPDSPFGPGTIGRVRRFDRDGDAVIAVEGSTRLTTVHPDGLLRVKELDRLAEERNPKLKGGSMELGFKLEMGDLIRLKDGSRALYHESIRWRRGIQAGDEVIIESPIYTSGSGDLVECDPAHPWAKVGQKGQVLRFDRDGDAEISPWGAHIHPDGLLRVKELDRLAEERNPKLEAPPSIPSDWKVAAPTEPTADGEVRITSETGGQKGIKPERYDLIPVEALREVALAYGNGALKYDERNWEKGYNFSLSYAALQRHANQFWAGEERDRETGIHHMASVIFHALALITFSGDFAYDTYDDRPGVV